MTFRATQLARAACAVFCALISASACSDESGTPAEMGFVTDGNMAANGMGMPATAGMAAPGAAGTGAGAAGVSGSPGTAGSQAMAGAGAMAGMGAAAAGTGGGAAGMAGMSAAGAGAAGAGAAGAGAAGAGGGAGGMGAAAGDGAVAGMGAAGAAGMPPMPMDLGMGDGSDVVTIGDSWMSYFLNGGGIEAGLAAASMQPYRNYAVAGTMLLDGQIPSQYARAKRDNADIKTVVMTGGGNDLLLTGMSGSCPPGSSCRETVGRVAVRLGELWEEMAADGVQDVVYLGYSRGGSNGPSVEYGNSQVAPECEAAPLRCHFIDSDTIIMMELMDGVHPTRAACSELGEAVYELMVAEGMRR